MNENEGGTPNPLNQNPLDANPSEPMESVEQAEPMEEINEVEISEVGEAREVDDVPVRQESSFQRPIIREEKPLTEELVEESVMTESVEPMAEPMSEPMEQVAYGTEAPKPRKKTGLIVGIVICLFIAVGCGVAAFLMMMSGDKDPVAAAMKKLMDGKMPENVVIDGDIEFAFNDSMSPISKVNIDLNSAARTGTTVNNASAEVALTFSDDEKLAFTFDEVYTEGGELYFKIDGVSALIEKVTLMQMLTEQGADKCVDDGSGQTKCGSDATNCIADETGETNCVPVDIIDCACSDDEICDCVAPEIVTEESMFLEELMGMFGGVINVIDGQWLKISMDEMAPVTDGLMDSDMTCMIDLIDGINTNSSSAAELYNKNPFIASTTDGVKVDSKANQVRQIVIDDENFANYVNSIQNMEMTSNLYDCLGLDGNVSIAVDDVAEIVGQLPAIYVEVDKDNNFSRLYFTNLSEDGTMTTTVDLAFTYPESINITEPEEYTSFEEIIQTIFMSMYDLDGGEIIEDEVVEGGVVEGEEVEF